MTFDDVVDTFSRLALMAAMFEAERDALACRLPGGDEYLIRIIDTAAARPAARPSAAGAEMWRPQLRQANLLGLLAGLPTAGSSAAMPH